MIREIVKDTLFLSQKSVRAKNTSEDKQIVVDLLDTLKANETACVGMAANMIGHSKCIIVISISDNVTNINQAMINPVIVAKKGAFETEEGCLSLSGTRAVTRYQNILVEYFDINWRKHKQKFSGWTAQIIQHECDHLEGIII